MGQGGDSSAFVQALEACPQFADIQADRKWATYALAPHTIGLGVRQPERSGKADADRLFGKGGAAGAGGKPPAAKGKGFGSGGAR